MTTHYMSGGKTPEVIHSFENFAQVKEHYLAARDISYGGNSYIIPINGETIAIKLQDISSEKDLITLYKTAIEAMKVILHNSKIETDTL